MSSFPQKPTADLKSVKSLLEKHNPREAYEILAAQIILANQRPRDAPPSRVQTAESHRIKITENKLQEIRTGRFGRVQLPSEEEARYWLQQWREGAKAKEETPIRKIVIRRIRSEVENDKEQDPRSSTTSARQRSQRRKTRTTDPDSPQERHMGPTRTDNIRHYPTSTAEPRHDMGRTQHYQDQAGERVPGASQPLGTRPTSSSRPMVRYKYVYSVIL